MTEEEFKNTPEYKNSFLGAAEELGNTLDELKQAIIDELNRVIVWVKHILE